MLWLKVDGLANNWLTVWYWQCVLWLKAGWTGKQLVDSMVLAVCVVTEGWMDWQTTGWQYGTGSVCCDWRLDGLANNWLTVWYWQCVLWLKSKHWQASEMELWANCQINVDSALFVRLDVLFACVSHFTQPVLTHWTLTHLVAASSHMHWTLTHVAAASSHTHWTLTHVVAAGSHTHWTLPHVAAASSHTHWTLTHVAAASSHTHTLDTYTCSCSQFSHTHWTLTHVVAAGSHTHWTLTHVAAASSHTHLTLTHVAAASSHTHLTLTHVAAASSHTHTHTGHLHM